MENGHRIINDLSPEQVVTCLYGLGEIALSKLNNTDIGPMPPAPGWLADKIEQLGPLLLHAAWLSQGAIHRGLENVLSGSNPMLQKTDIDLDVKIFALLYFLKKDIQIVFHNGSCEIFCSFKLLKCYGVEKLAESIRTQGYAISGKNLLIDSKIDAGRDVHIGDIYYYGESPKIKNGEIQDDKPIYAWPLGRLFWKRTLALSTILFLALIISWKYRNNVSSDPVQNSTVANISQENPAVSSPGNMKGESSTAPILTHPPKELQLSGIVVDQNDNTLAGVRVSCIGCREGVITTKTGNFTLQLKNKPSNGEARLLFEKYGYQTGDETYFQIPKLGIHKMIYEINVDTTIFNR